MDIEQVIRGLEPTTWGYTHMTRDRWAAQQHAIFDYGQVTSTVSTDPRDYASGTEIDAMLQALNVHRDQLGLSRPIDLDRKELRRRCFQAAKRLRDGEIPRLLSDGGDLPEVATLADRYQRAHDAAMQAAKEKAEARPVDDDAWEKELERRRKLERDGPIAIVTVGR